MKIENLEVGMIIKNYKVLCELLEVEPTSGGNAKKNQLREVSRYCKFHKDGNKFIIDEIYQEARPKKIDNRINNKGGNNMKYCDDIETLILHILEEHEGNEVNLSTNQLLCALNMINKNYQVGRTRVPKLSEILEIPTDLIYDFYDYTSVELKRKLETNLNRLQRQCLIFWRKSIKVQTTNVEIKYNVIGQPVLDSKGFAVQHKNIEHREATDIEMKWLLKIEREVLIDMGYKDKKQLFLSGNFNTFKNMIKNKIKYYELNIDYYYHSYKIIYHKEHIKQAISDVEKLESSKNLNENIVKSLKKSYENKHKVANKKVTTNQLGFEIGIKNDFDLLNARKIVENESYLENNNKLISILIDCRAVDYIPTLVQSSTKVELIKEKFINEDFTYTYKDDIPF